MPTSFLIISNCRLGDSIVMAPSLKLLKETYPQATITFASEAGQENIISAQDILGGRGLVDHFIAMSNPPGRLQRLAARLQFFLQMRRQRHDAGIVLFPPVPPLTMALVRRFQLYLRLCGIPKQRIVAPKQILPMTREPDGSLTRLPSVVDLTLRVLEPLGISLPPPGQADALLPAPLEPMAAPELPTGKRFLAVSPSANMPCNIWPYERYAAVLEQLPELTPIYFGANSCRALCERLHQARPGILVIGQPLTTVEAIMRRCHGYLGNDTGLMHMAAALGLPCAAIFSCRQSPGMWEPYTSRRQVFRAPHLPCDGCQVTHCPDPQHPCLNSIRADDVASKTRALLGLP